MIDPRDDDNFDGNDDQRDALIDALDTAEAELAAYHKLHDGLSDMIKAGRLCEADVPDDYRWLVETLEALGAHA